ncbi:MAG: GerMN domain-containing protein [Clostridia bacterium]|nr:GerMN domain-containing protein [Clostridia bacterium]
MKRRLAITILVLTLCLTLTACQSENKVAPAQTHMPAETTIQANTQQKAGHHALTVRLYFGYQDSAYLAAEERQIIPDAGTSPEKAVVEALLGGPSADQVSLTPLFPPDTQVLSVTEKDGTLFVTFNDALLGRYPGESGGTGNEMYTLRRRLCMASLVNTLTEYGFGSRVQVLVRQETEALTSLRLPTSFFRDTEDPTPVGPMYRDETVLFTPYNTAHMILDAWMKRTHDTLYGFLSASGSDGSPRPGQNQAYDQFDLAPVLMHFTLSPGVISPDGLSAVLCADLLIAKDGQDTLITAFPLRLVKENNIWRIPYDHLQTLFNTTY